MDLLDRYLQAVKFWLPRAQQDDIVAELSEDLRAQVEEQETKLGRQLNETETAAILKQRGRPLLVATRYLPQRYLIGPVLFPVYRFVLKIVILCSLLPPLMAWISRMTFDPSYRSTHSIGIAVLGAWGPFWLTAFVAVGVVTIVFAVLERAQSHSRFLEDWDPRKLRPVHDPNRIPRVNSVFELAITVVLVMWWVNGMWSQTLFDHAGVRIVLAPAWRVFFWAILWLWLANLALSAVNLFRPYWTWLRGGLRLGLDSAGSIAFCWLLKAHLVAQISVPNLSSARAAEIANLVNLNLERAFLPAIIACLVVVAIADGWRLVRLRAGRTRLIQGVAALIALAVLSLVTRA